MSQPPVAEVRPRSSALHSIFGGSKLWILTLLCLLIAGGLVWWSTPPRGTTIHIQFPEGHGLQPEDTVRYRGIEVGTVESVHLDDSLDGVEVEVLLKPTANQLAREGTRFWIVRPELSLTRISGLETAIGHKYIGVSPTRKEDALTSWKFQGLADVPVDTLSGSGIELILRGDKRYSVSKGSAVTFRGVDVGTVLDVSLSQESRHVDVRVRIFEQHTSLLTSGTKFWASSGLDLDLNFGLNGGGFNLDTESLETLARGGVSMITTGQGSPALPGDVFTLHASADDKWFEQAANFSIANVPLRGAIPIRATWTSRGLFGKKENVVQFNGVAIKRGDTEQVVFPSDALSDLGDTEYTLTIGGNEVEPTDIQQSAGETNTVGLSGFDSFDAKNDFASLSEPIDCLAVRRSEDMSVSFHLKIAKGSVKVDDEGSWTVVDFNGDRDVWHGAPVVSAADGKLVGILLVGSETVIRKIE